MNWRMPSETAPQERVWMAFPPTGGTGDEGPEVLHISRKAWADVAHAILKFEPVTMLVAPDDLTIAQRYLSDDIELTAAPLDDAWMRDMGPSFVLAEDGSLGAVNWHFNGWGQQSWAKWEKDQHISAHVRELAGAECVATSLVNEGGGIHVDGQGTVLLTESVQLDPGRNPEATREGIEAEMARTIGATHAIWLKQGLYRDTKPLGTRGHVDIVATMPSSGIVLVHDQQNPNHPDFAITREITRFLSEQTTADGTPLKIKQIPAPEVLRDKEDFVDYSYINHLVVNNGVIACTFNDPADETALAILAEAYPGRKIVGVDARAIFAQGGGIHCITQHQPATIK